MFHAAHPNNPGTASIHQQKLNQIVAQIKRSVMMQGTASNQTSNMHSNAQGKHFMKLNTASFGGQP